MDSLHSYSNILAFLAGDSSFYLGATGRKTRLHKAFDALIASNNTVLYVSQHSERSITIHQGSDWRPEGLPGLQRLP